MERKIKWFRMVKDPQMAASLHTTLQIVCDKYVFWDSACIYGGATRKIHPFLLLEMLLSFALVSLRYFQSVSAVVVTFSKLDFE